MAIQVVCPACGKSVNAPDNFAGRKAKCPQCKELIKVPALEPVGAAVAVEPTFDVDSFVREAETVREHAPPQHAPKDNISPQRVVIVGLRVPLRDAVGLIVTFWVAGFLIALALGAVYFVLTAIKSAT